MTFDLKLNQQLDEAKNHLLENALQVATSSPGKVNFDFI